MLFSLVAMDMVTTGLNNYIDYKKAKKKSGFGYEEHNAIVKYNLSEKSCLFTLGILSLISIIFGLILFLRTDIIVLLIGILSFGTGVFYTFGPIPISRTPLGELFSGLFQGFGIIFLGIYIHAFDQNFFIFEVANNILKLELNLKELLIIFLYSLPATFTIANIMLANNICDIEEDLFNHRFTLPVIIQKPSALKLFNMIYYLVYVDIIVLVILGIVPKVTLLVLITLLPVQKNLGRFHELQTKKDTFSLAIKNFILINGSVILTVLLGFIIQ